MFTTITHIIVSIAEDIYVGIRLIVNGIAYVFRQVLRVLEDVISAIGAFFKQLIKDIEDVIQALSILFHFGEIIKTQQFLLEEMNNRLFGLKDNPAYPGMVSAIKSTVIPKLNGYFERGEKAISGFFDTLANELTNQTASSQGPSINQFRGQGATVHTVYT